MPNHSPAVGCGPDGFTHILHHHWTDEGSTIQHVPVFADSVGPSEAAFQGEYFDWPSLAVGPDNMLHAVCAGSSGTLYARHDTSGWSPPETIAAGRMASIAIDSLLECHVVYDDVDSTWTSQVWYVHGTAGNWSVPEWLAGGNQRSARNASLTVARDGRLFVAYEKNTGTDLGIELRVRTGGSWSSPEWVGQGLAPSVAADSGSVPYVAHWGLWGANGLLLSFRREMPGWTQVTVDSVARSWGEMTYRIGLAIDSENDIHVTYCSRDERGGEDSEMWYAEADASTDVAGSQWPGGVRLVSFPNPVRGSVRFRFELPTSGSVRLDVHDVRGRLMQKVSLGTWNRGMHDAVWEGRSGDGRRLASGVYLLRLSTTTGSATRKIIVQR